MEAVVLPRRLWVAFRDAAATGRACRSSWFPLGPRSNYLDHSVTDQASAIRFIEDNWLNGKRLGGGSFDAIAGSPNNMFDFSQEHGHTKKLLLDPSRGQVIQKED